MKIIACNLAAALLALTVTAAPAVADNPYGCVKKPWGYTCPYVR